MISSRVAHIVPALPGWFAVHADQPTDDLSLPTSQLVSLRPVAAFVLMEDQEDSHEQPFQAMVCRDYSYGGVPSGFEREREDFSFIGYICPGVDLEVFRGAVLDHYEAKTKVRAA